MRDCNDVCFGITMHVKSMTVGSFTHHINITSPRGSLFRSILYRGPRNSDSIVHLKIYNQRYTSKWRKKSLAYASYIKSTQFRSFIGNYTIILPIKVNKARGPSIYVFEESIRLRICEFARIVDARKSFRIKKKECHAK